MPLGKTQAKYLYPEEKLSLLRKFNVVLDCLSAELKNWLTLNMTQLPFNERLR